MARASFFARAVDFPRLGNMTTGIYAQLTQILDLPESSVLLARFDVSTPRGYSNHETTHPLKIAERWPTLRFLTGFLVAFPLNNAS